MAMFFQKLLRLAKNFYVATGTVVLVWVLFFDTNDIISQVHNWMKLRDLEADKIYYSQKIEEVQQQQREIMGNARLQEKYARENYLMKKPGEDVYVLVDDKNQPIEKKSNDER